MDDSNIPKNCKTTTPTLQNQEEFDQDQDQDEEALSLSGLILNSDEVEFQDRRRSSSSDPSELFEFFSNRNSSEMSHAEDIIFCGKLIPYKEHRSDHAQDHPHYSSKNLHLLKHPTRADKQQSFRRWRSESLNELRTTPSSSAGHHHQLMRTSRSLDCQKLYGNLSSRLEKVDIERSSSTKSTVARFDATGSKEKMARPRWYMMFGLVKFPPEMDFQDMKSRQVRRNPGTLFSSVDSDGKALVNRDDHRRWLSSWDLLRVLSCKDHASVAVTTSFGCLQQI